MKKRLEYMDLCKVVAIYLVTFAHCAQQLCGEKFPNLLVTNDSFISINMAIFMIASGFFLNIDKMKATATKDYIWSKVQRLLFPMIGWYLVMCIVLFSVPKFSICWSIYWYLGSLFVCLTLIKLLTNIFSNILLVCIMSIIILTLIPMISFERSCYMIPFLWVGYGLRFVIDRVTLPVIIVLLCIYCIMYHFWDIRYSIYVSPFHLWDADVHSVFAMAFRFAIGVVGSIGFIGLMKLLIDCKGFGWMKGVAVKYGRYTLAFYTMSFVLNAILVRFLWHTNWFISLPGILDIVSLLVTTLMMVLMYFVQKLLEKNCITRLIFLGAK